MLTYAYLRRAAGVNLLSQQHVRMRKPQTPSAFAFHSISTTRGSRMRITVSRMRITVWRMRIMRSRGLRRQRIRRRIMRIRQTVMRMWRRIMRIRQTVMRIRQAAHCISGKRISRMRTVC